MPTTPCQINTYDPVSQNLPQVGYSRDQLKDYILRQLGAPTWNVELSIQQIYDCIQDAINMWSFWRPKPRYGNLQLVSTKFSYLVGADMGLGVVDVSFVDSVPAPTEIFYGNLISPAPLLRTGLDEYDSFLRWRKTWQRVTSVMADWFYDLDNKVLWIHNPIERYHAAVLAHVPYTTTESLPFLGADWVKKYSLAKARFLYGDVLKKFNGAIPGPIQDMTLDQSKRDDAKPDVDRLETELKSMASHAAMVVD